jgi:2-C-methyl-D-erythritol 2,4-cyclodiphosphate synthase/2-C-methyl-D-erythritol 4-phosphate cytidylyltransferase
MSATALIVAGGRGVRLDLDIPKPLVRIGRLPLLAYSLRTFEQFPAISHIVLVCGSDWLTQARRLARRYAPQKIFAVTPGGAERCDSVRAGLAHLPEGCSRVAIHDAARPFVKPAVIQSALEALDKHHGSAPGLQLVDTLRRHDNTLYAATSDRSRYVLMQTPQCFHREALQQALDRAAEEGFTGTDDVSYVERLPGARIAVTPGDPDNFKITTREDLERARMMITRKRNYPPLPPLDKGGNMDFRVGEGYDAHRLVEGRKLILGGVEIPFEKGLLGHSDADVLCHAIGDALLGAASLGDLGAHFPDSNPAYKGISSLTLLEKIAGLLNKKSYTISNIDATLILEQPKIAPHRSNMIENIAKALGISSDRVSVKATSTEGMGFEGRGEGISCRAVAVVHK